MSQEKHASAKAVFNFWFGSPEDPDYGKPRKVWFQKNPDFDEEIRSRFLSLYQQAAQGKLDAWQNCPESCLALIILLDQFPRNLFRNQPKMFATDDQALAVAQYAVEQGYDRQLLDVQRWFIYLPFEHSEDVAMQHRSVALFSNLENNPDNADTLDYAYRHFHVIQQFGRFPHRNGILGRESTPEEIAFLQQPGSSF